MSFRGYFDKFPSFKTKRKLPTSREERRFKRSRSLNDSSKNKALEVNAYDKSDSQNFWKTGNYKYVVERCENGYKIGNELIEMLTERASIEEAYAKSLKEWHKKYTNHLRTKSKEYETSKDSWQAFLNTGNLIAEVHMYTSKALIDNAIDKIKVWLKNNYERKLFGMTKEARDFEVKNRDYF